MPLAQSVLSAFGDSIRVATEEHGLRLYEDRGLDGFVDGTENPQGDDNVRNVAIIPEGKPDAGGSHVLLQKYLHDLKNGMLFLLPNKKPAWAAAKKPMTNSAKTCALPDSHLGRVNVKENGVGLKNCPPQPALRQTQRRTRFDVHFLLQHAAQY